MQVRLNVDQEYLLVIDEQFLPIVVDYRSSKAHTQYRGRSTRGYVTYLYPRGLRSSHSVRWLLIDDVCIL